MNTRRDAHVVRIALAAAVLVLGASVLAAAPRPAGAQAPQTPPLAGAWCGVADIGAVQMTVSADSRFVESISITTDRGTITSQEGTVVVPRAQIADDKFIFLGRDSERDRCEPVRCSGPNCLPGASGRNQPGAGRNECNRNPTTGIMIRGTFLSPEHVRGNFTGVISTDVQPGNGRGNTGARVVSRRVVGNYVAWPVGVAPCP